MIRNEKDLKIKELHKELLSKFKKRVAPKFLEGEFGALYSQNQKTKKVKAYARKMLDLKEKYECDYKVFNAALFNHFSKHKEVYAKELRKTVDNVVLLTFELRKIEEAIAENIENLDDANDENKKKLQKEIEGFKDLLKMKADKLNKSYPPLEKSSPKK